MENNLCWICYEEDNNHNIISPCLCSGSVKYVHEECLKSWLLMSENNSCPQCKYKYKIVDNSSVNKLSVLYKTLKQSLIEFSIVLIFSIGYFKYSDSIYMTEFIGIVFTFFILFMTIVLLYGIITQGISNNRLHQYNAINDTITLIIYFMQIINPKNRASVSVDKGALSLFAIVIISIVSVYVFYIIYKRYDKLYKLNKSNYITIKNYAEV